VAAGVECHRSKSQGEVYKGLEVAIVCSLLNAQLMATAPSHSPSCQTLGSIDVGLQIQLKAVIGQYCCGLLRMKEAKKRKKGVQVQQEDVSQSPLEYIILDVV
jgi:hypothetical protein